MSILRTVFLWLRGRRKDAIFGPIFWLLLASSIANRALLIPSSYRVTAVEAGFSTDTAETSREICPTLTAWYVCAFSGAAWITHDLTLKLGKVQYKAHMQWVCNASAWQTMQMHCSWEVVECCSRAANISVIDLFVPRLLCITYFCSPPRASWRNRCYRQLLLVWSHLDRKLKMPDNSQ